MGQAGRSDRALQVGLLSRATVTATLTGATLVRGAVVGEHLSERAPAGPVLAGPGTDRGRRSRRPLVAGPDPFRRPSGPRSGVGRGHGPDGLAHRRDADRLGRAPHPRG